MCGIFGSTKKIESDLAYQKLEHRGPDDHGLYEDDNFSMLQTRLSILDLSELGHQPMWDETKNFGIVFNGEIYNYLELRKNLELKGVVFNSNSDTEVILKGYITFGNKFFQSMRGMWAFAIYDKNHKKIILSRDFFGIKPLYYSLENKELIFASEVKALIPFMDSISANTSKYYLYYNLGYFPGDDTSFKEIKKLRPGSVATYDIEKKTFDTFFLELPVSEEKIDKEGEAVKVLRDSIEDSIRKHYLADVPVGVLLSGGNDSSLIAAISKKICKNPVCFNISIEGSNDNFYAEKVANHLGFEFISLKITEEYFKKQYEKVFEIIDQPTADVSFIPTSLVFSLLKGKTKVVLSGEGGDELFGGYERHSYFAELEKFKSNMLLPRLSLSSKFGLLYINPIISRFEKLFFKFRSLGSIYLYSSKSIDYDIKTRKVLDYLKMYYDTHPYKNKIQPNLFLDCFMYLPDNLMNKGDVSSMAYGIEARTPFLDKEVFFSASKVSNYLRLSKKYTNKLILKKVMEEYLPKNLIYRKKTGFGINIGKFGDYVLEDLKNAIRFHQLHKEELGVVESGIESLLVEENSTIILKKFPRFAYGLITNHKVMKNFLLATKL